MNPRTSTVRLAALWVVAMLVKGHDRILKLATEDYEVMPLLVRHLELLLDLDAQHI